jgi:hypothetical protein
MVRFLFESDEGNNVFIDNIRVSSTETVGLNFNSKDHLQIYPNPTKDKLNLSLTEDYSNGQLEIYDVYGKLIKRVKLTNELFQTIKVSGLAEGQYNLRFISSEEDITTIKKLIIIQ